MAIYQSRFTGQQIDEAVAKILYVAPKFNSIILYDDKNNIINSGTFEYNASAKTIQKVKLNIITGSNDIVSVKIGTSENGNNLYDGTMPNDYIINLDSKAITVGDSVGETTIYCTISDGTTTEAKNIKIIYSYYTYWAVTNSTLAYGISWQPVGSASVKDIEIQAEAGQYIWIASTGNYLGIYAINQASGKYNTDPIATTKGSATINNKTYNTYRTINALNLPTKNKFKLG